MRLYLLIGLFTSCFYGHSIQSAQTITSTMAGKQQLALDTLQREYEALQTLLELYQYPPEQALSTEQLALYNEAKGLLEQQEDISKGKYVLAVEFWHSDTLHPMLASITPSISIDKQKLIEGIEEVMKNNRYHIVKLVHSKWVLWLNNLPKDQTTIESQDLTKAFLAAVEFLRDENQVKAAYKNESASTKRNADWEIMKNSLASRTTMIKNAITLAFDASDPDLPENIEKKQLVQRLFFDWIDQLDHSKFELFSSAGFTDYDNVMLQSDKIIELLEKQFSKERQSLLTPLYQSIITSFNPSSLISAENAYHQIRNTIDEKRLQESYNKQLRENLDHFPKFCSSASIVKALIDAKVDSSGDTLGDQVFAKLYKDWKTLSIAALQPQKGDSQSIVNVIALQQFLSSIIIRPNDPFKDFWFSVKNITDSVVDTTVAMDFRNRIKVLIQEINQQTAIHYLKKHPQTILPDISSLSIIISDSTINVSFSYYLEQWKLWSDNTLKLELSLPSDHQYHWSLLKNNFGNIFGINYQCPIPVGDFMITEFNRLVDLYQNIHKTEFCSATLLQSIWMDFIKNATPDQNHFINLKRHLGGQELYNYIINYTKLYPSFMDIESSFTNAVLDKNNTNQKRNKTILHRGILKASFAKVDTASMSLYPVSRGFDFDMKVRLVKKGNSYSIHSIRTKVISVYGTSLSGINEKGNINLEPQLGKIETTAYGDGLSTSTQTVTLFLTVNNFGNRVYQANIGISKVGTANISRSDVAPVGNGIYKIIGYLEHKTYPNKPNTIQLVFSPNATLPNLPILNIDNTQSTITQKMDVE